MVSRTSLFIISFLITVYAGAQTTEATYKFTFNSNWSQITHPHPSGNIPANGHWSKLVGATHNSDVVFLMMGEHATPGVERIAELGANGVFFSEVNSAIGRGYANQIISGPSLSSALGQMIIDSVTTSSEFPLLSLASMIAPSPDWMIATNSIELLDNNNNWKELIELDLYPYDAGTDNGTDYISPNSNTEPPEPISSLQGIMPFSNEKIGTLVIELLGTTVGIDDVNDTNNLQVYPNPSNGRFTVSSTNQFIETISLYNYSGRLLQTFNHINSDQFELDLSKMDRGIYFLRIEDIQFNPYLSRIVKL